MKRLKREAVAFCLLSSGTFIHVTAEVLAALDARIAEDLRLTAALDNALCVGRSPYYGDAQYESEAGFIHQTGGGRLSLCSETEHLRWIQHYETARESMS